MQFLLTAFDGNDQGAAERRFKARPVHLEKIKSMKSLGQFVFGGAILNDKDQMTGSMVVYEFPDREELELYLKEEVYITGGVWQKIDIRPFRQAVIE
jgi:uncharacterized protein